MRMKMIKNLTSLSSLVPMPKERGKTARTVVLTSVAVARLVTALVRTALATPASNTLSALLWLTLLCASAPQTFAQGGIPLWTNRYDGPGNYLDEAGAVAIDSSGNVFVTGYSHGSSNFGDLDYATIKYSSAGVPLWTNRYDGPENFFDHSRAVAVDRSGNVFVTGWSYGSPWPD
jgi:hypothetical protein